MGGLRGRRQCVRYGSTALLPARSPAIQSVSLDAHDGTSRAWNESIPPG
jgi:hypothetical protein